MVDVAPYRISSEALLAINTFLDELLYFLVESARSLELVRIKMAIGQVLPTSLGKNAVQEAELELKTYVESGSYDRTQERTIEINPFPLQKVFEQFRVKCKFFSTLGERGIDDRDPDSIPDLYGSEGIHIAPSLAIYLTAVLEYVGEYIIISVAKASERHGVELAKGREVYVALIEDAQISPLFRRTNLKLELEAQRVASPTSPIPSAYATSGSTKSFHLGGTFPVNKDGDNLLRSPTSPMSLGPTMREFYNGTREGNGLGKDSAPSSPIISVGDGKNLGVRSTKSMQSLQNRREKEMDIRSVSSAEESVEKMKSFEHLISGNQTMKVSLTPNRLITIEPKGKEESLYEFLKNTSPETALNDPTGRIKKKDSKVDLFQRRGRAIDKLEKVSERSTPSSPRYTPLIPSEKSSPSSLHSATVIRKLSTRSGGGGEPSKSHSAPLPSSKPTSPSHLNPSLRHSKTVDQIQSASHQHLHASKSTGHLQDDGKSISKKVRSARPEPLNLDDDDDLFYPEGQRRPKRKHQAQDLIDFLNTTPPSEMTEFPRSVKEGTSIESGKKKEKKFKKLLLKLMKSPPSNENSTLDHGNSSNSPDLSTTNSRGSNSTSVTSAGKMPRYVKIQIPQMPTKEENREQSIFDRVEQARHARHMSRASLSGSTRSVQTPNRTTFSVNEGIQSPTSNAGPEVTSCDNRVGIEHSMQSPSNKSNNAHFPPVTEHTSVISSKSNDINITRNNYKTSPVSAKIPDKFTSPVSANVPSRIVSPVSATVPDDKIVSPPVSTVLPDNISREDRSQTLMQKEQNNQQQQHNASPIPIKDELQSNPSESIRAQNVDKIPPKHKSTSTNPIPTPSITKSSISKKQSKKSKEIVRRPDGFLRDIISAELRCKEDDKVQQQIIIEYTEEEEREEALVVEWLLGTGLAFKSAMTYVDIVQVYEENPDMQNQDDGDVIVAREDDAEVTKDPILHIVV
ncbi:11605_t:CDS:2 [Acaulospora colombiana]|uniref:11605_t:CDS:1 n=1 Tax=Acaulospora colombiana TaxID=27376 RepID=A0ACA9KZ04_9GLOM|nr:11605_t:CDS:2 [Acaulospora colombiana]